jgi:hypothetical protein
MIRCEKSKRPLRFLETVLKPLARQKISDFGDRRREFFEE